MGWYVTKLFDMQYFEETLLLKISFVIYTIEGVEKPLHTVECVNNLKQCYRVSNFGSKAYKIK